jgi:hypothetical protein
MRAIVKRMAGRGLLTVLVLAGCAPRDSGGGSEGGGPAEEPVCARGETQSCACVGGGESAQECSEDRLGWDACHCEGVEGEGERPAEGEGEGEEGAEVIGRIDLDFATEFILDGTRLNDQDYKNGHNEAYMYRAAFTGTLGAGTIPHDRVIGTQTFAIRFAPTESFPFLFIEISQWSTDGAGAVLAPAVTLRLPGVGVPEVGQAVRRRSGVGGLDPLDPLGIAPAALI